MTRPLLAAIVIGVILGGTALYTRFLDYLRDRAAEEAKARQAEIARAAQGRFAIDLTFTAAAQPDPFQSEGTPSSVVLLLGGAKGKELLRRTDEVAAGSVIRISPVEGIREGENAFYLEASPVAASDSLPMAVRIRVLKIDTAGREHVLGENTFWATGGEKASGTLIVGVEPAATLHEH